MNKYSFLAIISFITITTACTPQIASIPSSEGVTIIGPLATPITSPPVPSITPSTNSAHRNPTSAPPPFSGIIPAENSIPLEQHTPEHLALSGFWRINDQIPIIPYGFEFNQRPIAWIEEP